MSKRVQISSFSGFFCLKGTLPEPKTFTGVLFSDTEGLWNVWAKTEIYFPNQPYKNWSICFELLKTVQDLNFSGFFFLKSILIEQKTFTGVLAGATERLCKIWDQTECLFLNQTPQNWSFYFELPKMLQISHFIGFFCLKGTFLE